ncbi:MAG TPA: ABC transporter substrate-binding protein [Oligoflexus sp.]|uniref:ABC transporter substrate-binding protein n=1 Tax=Oligoflexus sp. TaxID=1971216 RepID=UPI002D4EC2FE|nr:ABC transporter substrate-binding protein [Oligoflexus sp.]HYX31897.1 ABC transporter substrate-binding protein [Oligoflexus sp.]
MLRFILVLLLVSKSWLGLAASPQRIASATVGTDEILFDILSRRQELHRLIAVSIFSDNKSYSHLDKLPSSIKGRVGDSVEALLALKPDLVIVASYNRQEISHQVKAAGIPIITQDNFRSLMDIQNNIRLIGRVTGTEKEAEALVQEMQRDLHNAKPKQACKKGDPTFLQYSGYDTVPGADTIINDAAAHAGLINLAARLKLKGWAPLSQEVLATLNPDFIIVAGDPAQAKTIHKQLKKAPAWQKLAAVQAGRVVVIPERQLYTVSHHVTKLVRTLADARTMQCP